MTENLTGRVLMEAERQQARYQLLTTGEVAARLSSTNIDADTVRSWIEAGWLKAVDCRKKDATRPYWMIEWAWVETFIRERSNREAA